MILTLTDGNTLDTDTVDIRFARLSLVLHRISSVHVDAMGSVKGGATPALTYNVRDNDAFQQFLANEMDQFPSWQKGDEIKEYRKRP